eukprot:sb/3478780/
METGRVMGVAWLVLGVAWLMVGVTTVRLEVSRGSLCVTPEDGCRFRSVLRALVGLGREPVEVRLVGDSGTVGAGGTMSVAGAGLGDNGAGLGDRARILL